MMYLFIGLLVVGAHFSLTAFAPGPAGKASFYWPFAADSHPVIAGVGGLPNQPGSLVTQALAAGSGMAFIGAVLSLYGWLVDAEFLVPLVVAGALLSAALHVLYFSKNAILPLVVDALLLVALIAYLSLAGAAGA